MDERPQTTADGADAETDRALARDPEATEATVTEQEPLDPILPADEADRLRGRWHEIQTGFVDDPRDVVERADALVDELMQRLARTFAEEREALESQWGKGEGVSTEDLRVALQRYRSFFERLLAT